MNKPLILGVLLASMGICGSLGAAQDPNHALQLDEVVSLHISSQPFWEAHFDGRLFNSGVIYDAHPKIQEKLEKPLTFSISSVTLRVALDALMAGDTTYSWVAEDDAIVFIPKKRPRGDVDPVKTLNQIMPHFDVREANIVDALQELKSQAEAQGLRAMPKPQEEWIPSAKDPQYEYEGAFNLHLKNKTVRQCLNAIVAADPPASWFAFPYKDYVFIGVSTSHSHAGRQKKH